MERVLVAVLGVVAMAGLAACGGGRPEGVGFGGPPPVPATTPAPVPDGPVPPPGGRQVPAVQVDAAALPEAHPRLVWTREVGAVLGVYGQEGGCSSVRAELVTETPDAVQVRLVETVPTAGPCTMDLRFPALTVPLTEPLGERTVVLQRQQVGPLRR